MNGDQLRQAFTDYFVGNGHTLVPSASLIPHHPAAPLLVNAGMVQFIPIFLGEEAPPWPTATSVQKCFRTGDVELVGHTGRHFTFFEMLGNFSFGDYFKEKAIPFGWEFVTERLGIDADRVWVTVYHEDDEAEAIWLESVGVPRDRVQRMGEDNFWEMQKGAPGPCGMSSELWYDHGPELGEGGGPAHGDEERFVEIWNLVFMQLQRLPDGSLVDLPRKNIDTGAGFERILPIVEGVTGPFASYSTSLMAPVMEAAQSATGRRYGQDERTDAALRVLADHARGMSFLVADGVMPSNDGRGYVLRRVIRRAVLRAHQLGADRPVMAGLFDAVRGVMGGAYPELERGAGRITEIIGREEARFRQTLRSGSALLDEVLESGEGRVSGQVAFLLHDTHGFPVELTQEIAAERGVEVDMAGFESEMAQQRARARQAGKEQIGAAAADERYRQLLEENGPTEFLGYGQTEATGRVLAVLERSDGELEVFLDRTPFYAEGGGQVGDTGTVTTETGTFEVTDTTYALPGLHRHVGRVRDGDVTTGQDATAAVDAARRDDIRRNHTGTHLLQWALREVLGDHVQQQGSLVAPDRLRFDYSHFAAPSADELRRVEELVNDVVISDAPVRAYETSMNHAQSIGAIAFFGDRYGDVVRVVEAGPASVELCGGTHVGAVGMIGPLKIVSEGSIGANTRRIEAVTGRASLAHIESEEDTLERVAEMLRSRPEELADAVGRLLERQKAAEDELKAARRRGLQDRAVELAEAADNGQVVARVDGIPPDQLRELATAIRSRPGVQVVVLGGSPDGERAALVSAVGREAGWEASDLIGDAARLVGGGGGRHPELATAGGRDPARLDEALEGVRARLAGGKPGG